MVVTVNTDASFHPIYKVGAYAFWIVCNEGKIVKSGRLKKAINSTDAETRCIVNALYTVLHSDFRNISKIIINTDSMNSIDKIKKKSKAGSVYRKAYNLLQSLKRYHKVCGRPIHEFRHVKAHSGTDNKRKWVNDWCDKQAKFHLRKLIKELKNNGYLSVQ